MPIENDVSEENEVCCSEGTDEPVKVILAGFAFALLVLYSVFSLPFLTPKVKEKTQEEIDEEAHEELMEALETDDETDSPPVVGDYW